MSISTYSDLKSAVADWIERADLNARASDLVTLAEARLNRSLPLNANRVDAQLVGSLGYRTLELPDDFYEPISLKLTTFGIETLLKPLVSGLFNYGTYNGVPNRWCINGENIDLDVPCDQSHTFVFRYRKAFKLSDSCQTNWLLTNAPDVYLHGCLVEAAYLTQDMDKLKLYEARLTAAIEQAAEQDARNAALATLSVDPALMPPVPFNINSGM